MQTRIDHRVCGALARASPRQPAPVRAVSVLSICTRLLSPAPVRVLACFAHFRVFHASGFEQEKWVVPTRAVARGALDKRLAAFRLDIPASVEMQVPFRLSGTEPDGASFVQSMLGLSLDSVVPTSLNAHDTEDAVYFVPMGTFGAGTPAGMTDTTLFQRPIWLEQLQQTAASSCAFRRDPTEQAAAELDVDVTKRRQLRHPCAIEVQRGGNSTTIGVFWCPIERGLVEGETAGTEWKIPVSGSVMPGLTIEANRRMIHNVERFTQALYVFATSMFSHQRSCLRLLLDRRVSSSREYKTQTLAACVANALFGSLTGSTARIRVEGAGHDSTKASAEASDLLVNMSRTLLASGLRAMPLGELCGVLVCWLAPGDEGGGDDAASLEPDDDGPPPLEDVPLLSR